MNIKAEFELKMFQSGPSTAVIIPAWIVKRLDPKKKYKILIEESSSGNEGD